MSIGGTRSRSACHLGLGELHVESQHSSSKHGRDDSAEGNVRESGDEVHPRCRVLDAVDEITRMTIGADDHQHRHQYEARQHPEATAQDLTMGECELGSVLEDNEQSLHKESVQREFVGEPQHSANLKVPRTGHLLERVERREIGGIEHIPRREEQHEKEYHDQQHGQQG